MILLWTLLTFFVDGEPDVPSPAIVGAITVPGELDAKTTASVSENLGLPRLTPATWHASPSLMVAHPPASAKTFDVFSPAVRAPQELPGLFPCEPVALVPCPSPEPPAVRHVSFMDDLLPQPAYAAPICQTAWPKSAQQTSDRTQLAANNSDCDSQEAGSKCPTKGLPLPSLATAACEKPHVGEYSDACPPYPVFPHPPIHPPHPPHFGHMPVAFAAPFGGPLCPAGGPCPVVGETPFPGAKKVQHVVRATYDVPHDTAKALKPILEQSQGVLECTVEGDELTINAVGPAQSAIAQFLVAVVAQPRMISKPAKAVDVKFHESSCCNDRCECKDKCQCCGSKKPAKAIEIKFQNPKCCNDSCECKDPCKCCGSKEPAQASDCNAECPKACAKAIKCPVTLECPMVNVVKDATGKVFAFSLGFERSGTCSKVTQCTATSTCKEGTPCTTAAQCTKPCEAQTVVQWKSATQSKPVKVFITATSEGVTVKTSDGTQLRAQQIQLETEGIHKLEVQNGDAVFTMPKPQQANPFRGEGQLFKTQPSPLPKY